MDKCGCSDDKTYGPHGSRIVAMLGYKGGVYKFPVCDRHVKFYEETGNWDITILTEPEPVLVFRRAKGSYRERHGMVWTSEFFVGTEGCWVCACGRGYGNGLAKDVMKCPECDRPKPTQLRYSKESDYYSDYKIVEGE